jgi:polyisoprenoid-binding protein YceI
MSMKGHLRRPSIAIALAALFVGPATSGRAQSIAPGEAVVRRIDPARSEVRFSVTKLGCQDVTGVFRECEGEIRYDPANPAASSIWWRVRVASILTDASNRDSALQQPEYFDAARHPYLSFASRTVRAGDSASLEVSGDITIRGTTRPLSVVVRPRRTTAGLAFETDFAVDRYDFGVAGGMVMGRLIGRQVRVHLIAATAAVTPPASRHRR